MVFENINLELFRHTKEKQSDKSEVIKIVFSQIMERSILVWNQQIIIALFKKNLLKLNQNKNEEN